MKEMLFMKGDIVEISNDGYQYSSYDKMADALGLKKWYARANKVKDILNGDECTVVGMRQHLEHNNDIVCGVLCHRTGLEYLIEQRGLTLIKRPTRITFDDKLFEV